MIYVLIEHFLRPEADRFFIQWVDSVKDELEHFPGFIRIQRLTDVEDVQGRLILLQFDSLENLRSRAASDRHHDCLERLKPFMLQKQKSQLWTTDK